MALTNAFIGRQAVLNRNQQLIGYELLFRLNENTIGMGDQPELQADTEVLINTLNNMGTHWLIGNKLAFINVGEAMLASGFLELLPAKKIILDISPRITPSGEIMSRLRYLRSQGFGIALDDFSFDSPATAFLELANYVKLDILNRSINDFQLMAVRLRSYPVIRIAERIETHEQFDLAKEAGIDGFQGFYFAKPETLSAKVINQNFKHILELLNLLRQDAPLKEIDLVLKRDVALSFKLLRYVNSAAAGLNTAIASFAQAVTILGYHKLYRWLTLLLITGSDENQIPEVLQKTAITRGRMMELLGLQRQLSPAQTDDYFVVGLFSLLDALFDMPMPQVLMHLKLPDHIIEALEHGTGELGTLLSLVKSCEKYPTEAAILCQQLNITSEQLNEAQTSALAWTEQLSV